MTDPRGEKIKVGPDGYVQLVDFMGNDKTIVNAARVSFGKNNDEPLSEKDRKLIHYLMHHRHTTPFEHVTLTFKVRVPMDTWRQWVRHRTASINEYSTRYSEAIDSMATTAPGKWRKQAEDRRQGSSDEPFSLEEGTILSEQEAGLQALAREVYKSRLEMGVAREQARKDLPLSTYTEAYWTINLHNMFHFIELRWNSEAQQEISEYAGALYELTKKVCPEACWAFWRQRIDVVHLNSFQRRVLYYLDDKYKVFIPESEVKETFDKVKLLYAGIARDEEYHEILDFLDNIGVLEEPEEEEE